MISTVVTECRIRAGTHYDVICDDQSKHKGINVLSSKVTMHRSSGLDTILVNDLVGWLSYLSTYYAAVVCPSQSHYSLQ